LHYEPEVSEALGFDSAAVLGLLHMETSRSAWSENLIRTANRSALCTALLRADGTVIRVENPSKTRRRQGQ
jgi:translation elongation factor EF-4